MKYNVPDSCEECGDKLPKKAYYTKHKGCVRTLFYTHPDYIPIVSNKEEPSDAPELFGIELELPFRQLQFGGYGQSRSQAERRLERKLVDLNIAADLGYDGGGIEFRFFPTTFKAYTERRRAFKSLFKYLNEMRAYVASGAGIHVHVSKSAFDSDLHLYKFLKLVYRNQSPVTQLAGRRSNWAVFTGKRLKDLKQRAEATLSPRPRFRDWLEEQHYYQIHGGKFRAINTLHRNTVEVRLFKTTNSVSTFYAYLQFVKAAVDFSRKYENGEMNWNNFDTFVGRKRIYKDLRTLIEERVSCA